MTTPSQTPAQPEPAQQTAPLDWARTLTTPTQQPDRAPGPEGPAPQSQAERAPATTVPGNTGPGTTVPGTTVPGATVSVAAADAHTAPALAPPTWSARRQPLRLHWPSASPRSAPSGPPPRCPRGRRALPTAGVCRVEAGSSQEVSSRREDRAAPSGCSSPSGRSAPAGSCLASSCRVDRYLAASRARDSSSRAARRATPGPGRRHDAPTPRRGAAPRRHGGIRVWRNGSRGAAALSVVGAPARLATPRRRVLGVLGRQERLQLDALGARGSVKLAPVSLACRHGRQGV